MKFSIILLSFVLVHADIKHVGHSLGARRGFRIVAGRSAKISEYPYQVSLEKSHRHWCGGTIISEWIVISAAHCAEHAKNAHSISGDVLRIRAGCEMSEVGGVTYNVESLVIHDKYSPYAMTDDFDISVIKTATRIVFDDKVQPINLVSTDEEPTEGARCTVTGWGYQDLIPFREERTSRVLMVIEIPVVKHSFCEQLFKAQFGNVITDTMICAGNRFGNMDACKGDSGGPLVVNHKLAGVTSWGQGCGQEGIPGIYMSIAKFRPWIDSSIKDLMQGRVKMGSQSKNSFNMYHKADLKEESQVPSGLRWSSDKHRKKAHRYLQRRERRF